MSSSWGCVSAVIHASSSFIGSCCVWTKYKSRICDTVASGDHNALWKDVNTGGSVTSVGVGICLDCSNRNKAFSTVAW